MNDIYDPVERILFSKEEISSRVKELAKAIDEDYSGKEPLLLSVLNGSFMFTSDLMKELTITAGIAFVFASSYGSGTTSSGNVQINSVKGFEPEGKDIIIVEDIIDTGRTLKAMKEFLLNSGANSVEICTFLNKPSRRTVDIDAKYIGYDVPDEFVIGYGLDFDSKYRQFPFVGVLKKEYYE